MLMNSLTFTPAGLFDELEAIAAPHFVPRRATSEAVLESSSRGGWPLDHL